MYKAPPRHECDALSNKPLSNDFAISQLHIRKDNGAEFYGNLYLYAHEFIMVYAASHVSTGAFRYDCEQSILVKSNFECIFVITMEICDCIYLK